ncbi:MAG: type IV secretion system DotC family protein [Micavibrio sp.]
MVLPRPFSLPILACLLILLSVGTGVQAFADEGDPPLPPSREFLEGAEPVMKVKKNEDGQVGLPFNIREDAIREAALSYGARGGLAARTYEIRQDLEKTSSYMDKVFDFSQLLIPAPSGLLIEPPIISEDDNAMIIGAGGQEAAVADRIYNINVNAKIVAAPRVWRNYLERDWGEVTPPPDVLLPENQAERDTWIKYVRQGWDKGYEQANEIFQDDLHQLTADYQGMVRYRVLLAQRMITPPYALQVDRGVTGGGNQMRVGDRAIQITGRPEFTPGADQWQPANR